MGLPVAADAVVVAPATVAELRADAMPLMLAHFLELEDVRPGFRFNPWWDFYERLEAVGNLVCLAARVGGDIVGYSVAMLHPAAHDHDQVVCISDVIYVGEAHRRGGVGLSLINETEALARASGASLMLWHAKPGTVFEAVLSRRCAPAETVWSRRLGDG